MAHVEVQVDDLLLGFGPFVGYYFKPVDNGNTLRLSFRCYNEQQFYTEDLPADALLYTGTAVFTELPAQKQQPLRGQGRIEPLFFPEALAAWLPGWTLVQSRRTVLSTSTPPMTVRGQPFMAIGSSIGLKQISPTTWAAGSVG